MNSIIGALVVSMSLGTAAPVNTQDASDDGAKISHSQNFPSPEETHGLILFDQTEEERIAEEEEEKRIAEEKRLAEEKRKAEEAAKKAEEERIKKEQEEQAAKDSHGGINFDYDIASYITYYSQRSSDANRNYNMLLASDSINGIILNPGDTFSYNDVILSRRTPKRDYKDAGVISNGEIVDAIGGGICQISSTLYNAALYSGMTITERRNHSLKVGYLPAGRDATASWGSIDFCFRNDLSVPVKIESVMKNGAIKIRFLSPSDPGIGKIDLKVTENNGVYTLYRYVDGVVDYTAKSVYKK